MWKGDEAGRDGTGRDGTGRDERKEDESACAREIETDRKKERKREREGSREIRNTPADRDGQENQSTRNNWY